MIFVANSYILSKILLGFGSVFLWTADQTLAPLTVQLLKSSNVCTSRPCAQKRAQSSARLLSVKAVR